MQFSKGRAIFVALVCVFSILIALGNFYDLGIFSANKVNLGLDLKGGSQILLQVDYDAYIREQLQNTIGELKSYFRENRIRVVPRLKLVVENGERENYIVVSTANADELEAVKQAVRKVNAELIVSSNDNVVSVRFDRAAMNAIKYKILQQSIEIVRNRIDETGTKEPIIQAQGRDKILVQVPGMESPDELKKVLGKTAKMTFHFVNTSVVDDSLLPPGVEKMKEMNGNYVYYVNKNVVLNGDLLQDANATYSEGKPAVAFRFNGIGSKKFAEITKNNVGKILAIVLDNEVITAPRINTPIMGGSGIISGNFTSEEANQVAILLRAGALPVPLEIIEERIVGPSLGQDSIRSGLQACAIGFVFVLIFMVLLYKKFGMITNFTLIINLIVTLAALSLLNATLTLPGIAGIVLSIGMAVDTNVLIFERIREEYKLTGKVYNSVSSGFDFAWTTIFDSNITTLLTAIILYVFGTGAVRGFALVLGIGIFISLFSGVLLTKLLLSIWLEKFQPKTINI